MIKAFSKVDNKVNLVRGLRYFQMLGAKNIGTTYELLDQFEV